jgi:cytochrome P450
MSEMDANGEYNLRKFGPIVREVINANHTIVHVFDPKDIESVFRQEGKYPFRRSHRALLKYRRERPQTYSSGGLFPENGEEWYRLRKLFQKQLLNQINVNRYITDCQIITQDLIRFIRKTRDSNKEVVDFQRDLYKWSLENTGVLALDSRLGCFDLSLNEESDALKLIKAAHETHEAVMRTEMTNNWEKFETKDYKMLVSAQDCMTAIIDNYLEKKINELLENDTKEKSVLSQFLNNEKVDKKDIFAMIVDLFLAGIDTTAFTAGFALYYLALNIETQKRLRNEINSILMTKSEDLSGDKLSRMPYLKACVKETMRLRPVSIGVGRLTTHDILIRDYIIPKGTLIITQNQVSCRQSEYFSDPNSFIPERWLKDSVNFEKRSPFLLLPFGYGPRMCIGRRFAEMEIYVLLAKIIQNFHIEYHYENIGIKTRLINVANKPMKYKFIDL